MKNFKTVSINIIILLIFFHYSPSSYSQITPKEYNCYRASSAVEIDGYVYDDVWKNINWSDFFVDIEDHNKPKPYYDTRMKMLWDDNYLYIAAELEDLHTWATLDNHDDIIYRDNDFEIFIDPDGDGLNYFEIEINALGTILDLFLAKTIQKKGKG